MVGYELSEKADQDLTAIYRYSFETFGEAKADEYFLRLEECLKALSVKLLMGRLAHEIEEGLYRYQHARHTIFYVVRNSGIFVARILHQSMNPKRHLGGA